MTSQTNDTVAGLCECGCKQITQIIPASCAKKGLKRGEHFRFCHGHNRRLSPLEYLVEDRGYETECWIWQRGLISYGYGCAHVGKLTQAAHIVYWEKKNGPVPEGKELHHLCEVRACVNPQHLVPLTKREHRRVRSDNKLDMAAAEEIKAMRLEGNTLRSIGLIFGISEAMVSYVCLGKSWVK